MDQEHLLHNLFTPTTHQQQLKSRHPFVPAALELLKDLDKSNTTAALWADHKWNTNGRKILLAVTLLFHLLGPSQLGNHST